MLAYAIEGEHATRGGRARAPPGRPRDIEVVCVLVRERPEVAVDVPFVLATDVVAFAPGEALPLDRIAERIAAHVGRRRLLARVQGSRCFAAPDLRADRAPVLPPERVPRRGHLHSRRRLPGADAQPDPHGASHRRGARAGDRRPACARAPVRPRCRPGAARGRAEQPSASSRGLAGRCKGASRWSGRGRSGRRPSRTSSRACPTGSRMPSGPGPSLPDHDHRGAVRGRARRWRSRRRTPGSSTWSRPRRRRRPGATRTSSPGPGLASVSVSGRSSASAPAASPAAA